MSTTWETDNWPHWEAMKDTPEDTHEKGSDHYKMADIEPIDYIMSHNMLFPEGNVIKYVSRYAHTENPEDIRKAIHYLEFILERDKEAEEWIILL